MTGSFLIRTVGELKDSRRLCCDEIDKPAILEWLQRLEPIYRMAGVVRDEFSPALHGDGGCPSRDACWRRFVDAARPHGSSGVVGPCCNGSIYWPWVGEYYLPGGVCIVGLNVNHGPGYWSPAVEYKTSGAMRAHLSRGQKTSPHRSRFPYRTLACAGMVLASLSGEPVDPEPRPQQLTTVLDRVARLQAVKCAPFATVVKNGAPKAPMFVNCPPRFLHHELRVLRPATIVAFGNHARDGVMSAATLLAPADSNRDLGQATIEIDGTRVELLRLAHPAATGTAGGAASRVSLRACVSAR